MLDLAPGISSGSCATTASSQASASTDGDPRIVGCGGHRGRRGKAQAGHGAAPGAATPDINIVYTVNEPAAFGAADALKAAGKGQDDVVLVSVDGGCDAIKDGVRTGVIDATAQQYPENMAREGVEAVAGAARGGASRPATSTPGVELITDDPVEGVDSQDEAFGVRNCWG